jgi:fluoroacetyl-CoA thioesterase
MRSAPAPGATHVLSFVVSETKTVPHLYPESPEFRAMPAVFATGFMVGLMEWACVEALAPHLEDGEGSLGVEIAVTHSAATVPGQTVTVRVECLAVEGNRIAWRVEAHDGLDTIGAGTHRRAVVRWDRFGARLAEKRDRL